MGKLRVGSPPHSRRAGLALAQALLVAADEYEQMAGYDQVTVLNNSCFDSEPDG